MPLISESQPDHINRNYTYMYVPYSYEKKPRPESSTEAIG